MKNIYKAGFIALVATPLFGLFSQNTYAIMPSTFNDENFYNCVVENFTSQYPDEAIAESGLTNEQLGKMSSLDCTSRYITNTTGLELMTSLTELTLSSNRLTSIDLSKNVNLTFLNLHGNRLTSIDLSKNVNLDGLFLSSNQLTSIDVSKNVNLTRLALNSNQLTSIDISKNPDLEMLAVDPTVVVETGVLPESDGDLSTYDFSKFQNILVNLYLTNPCDELDDSLSEECVFEWDRENVRLNV
ncbi:MAG: leucine-rich repeat domain-containing protein, partial [Candidatus Saccharibacteria bacterium]|nr:leucine-rich repeat domain-containing protein [Candidatus Saccharibacteria bacterium]